MSFGLGRMRAAGLASLMFFGVSGVAMAQSAGCLDIDGDTFASATYGPYFSATALALDEGETITVSGDAATATWEFSTGSQTPGNTVYPSSGSFSQTYTVPSGGQSGFGLFDSDYTGPGTFTNLSISCAPATPLPAPGPIGSTIADDPEQAMGYVAPYIARFATTSQVSSIMDRVGRRFANATDQSRAAASDPIVANSYGPTLANAASVLAIDDFAAIAAPYRAQGSVWADLQYGHLNSSVSGGAFNGDMIALSAGADWFAKDNFLFGVSFAADRASIDTDFNNGTLEGRAVGVAPYAAWNITDSLILDVAAGYSNLAYDMERSGGTITSEIHGDRFFASAGISGETTYRGFTIAPELRGLYVYEQHDGYTDSSGAAYDSVSFDFATVTASLQVSRTIDAGEFAVEPFVGVSGNWMFHQPDAVTLTTGEEFQMEEISAGVSLGVNIIGDTISGGLEVSHQGLFSDDSYSQVKASVSIPF